MFLQGWPQSPVLPFPDVVWDPASRTVTLVAVADWLPAGRQAPGPKQVHLQLFGFENPKRPGAYDLAVTIRPDPADDRVLHGTGRAIISPRPKANANPNSLGNGSPPPPFPNTLFQEVTPGDDSLTMTTYLWDRDAKAIVGADFVAGSATVRPIEAMDGRPIGWVRVRAPRGAENWNLRSGGPSSAVPAIITGIETGRLNAVLTTDPAVTGTYVVEISLHGGNTLRHEIVAG